MNYSHRSSSNNLVRQVLKEIISDPPSSSRKPVDFEQVKLNEAVTYLEKKIERQQSEIKVISEQLGKEIETKQHLISLLNEEKEKNCKLNHHLTNSNKMVTEAKKRLTKFENAQAKELKIKEQYELKLAKCRDMLRRKEDQLNKVNAKIEQLETSSSNISEIEKELKALRDKMMEMNAREVNLIKQIEGLSTELEEEKHSNKVKDEAILFLEEHLRRLKAEYEQFEYEQYKEQEESRSLQIEMKQLLEKQNEEIKYLNEQLSIKESVSKCQHSLARSEIQRFMPEKPEWQLSIFKGELKRAIGGHVRDSNLKQRLQADILVIFEAIESSFNGILSQVMNGFE